jgi:ketosteroid isomerase-like protein
VGFARNEAGVGAHGRLALYYELDGGLSCFCNGHYLLGMASMLERLRDAMNSHDATKMASLFADTYQSSQPLHPARGFSGYAQVLKNWTSVFEGVPDFNADLVAFSVDGAIEWGEWDWRGQHADGSPFAMRGVTILLAREGLVAEMRLYVEPVDVDSNDIDDAVRELYRPPSARSD